MRGLYAPFESGQLSGSADVYMNEITGGQYTNMLFQSKQLGLGDQWPAIKKAYAAVMGTRAEVKDAASGRTYYHNAGASSPLGGDEV